MDMRYFWEFILVLIYRNQQNFVMVLWIFQMELDWCKKLEVFFCGTVQLFAHFILCYRGMSLTSVDFFMCLELYIKSVISDNCELLPTWFLARQALVPDTIVPSGQRNFDQRSCAENSCGQPADRASYTAVSHNCSIFTLNTYTTHTHSISDHDGGQPDRIRTYFLFWSRRWSAWQDQDLLLITKVVSLTGSGGWILKQIVANWSKLIYLIYIIYNIYFILNWIWPAGKGQKCCMYI